MPCGEAQGEVAEMTICDDKEDAPWHLNMSRSNLKAQNEQAQVKPYSANAEDQFGSTLNEPTY